MHQWFGGYWHNKLDGKRYGGTDDTVLRGSFHAEAGPIDWVFRADYSKVKGDGITDIEFDKNSVSSVQLARLQTLLAGGPDTNFNDRNFNQFVTADLHDSQWGVNSTLSWDVGGGSTVRLIDSYRDWKNTQLDGDVVFSPAPVISRHGNFASKSQNHELQFISPTKAWLNGHFDMVGGLYYFREKYSLGENFDLNSQYCNVAFFPPVAPFTALKPACNAYPGGEWRTLRQCDRPGRLPESRQLRRLRSGQLLSERQALRDARRPLHEGQEGRHVRADGERVHRQGNIPRAGSADVPGLGPKPFHVPPRPELPADEGPSALRELFDRLQVGRLQQRRQLTAFVDVRREREPRFDQAHLRSRDGARTGKLGAKTSWLDHKLTLNLNFYRMDISGYQDRAFDGVSFTVLNAGKLRQQGFEFDAVARPLHGLSLFANVAYLDSNFLDYPNAPGLPGCATPSAACTAAGLGATQDLRGKPAPNSPKWSGRLGFDWAGGLGSTGWTWDATSNLSFFSKQYEGIITDANPQTIEPSYAVLGARLSISGPGDRWTASLFGNNLLNKQYGLANLYQPLDSLDASEEWCIYGEHRRSPTAC